MSGNRRAGNFLKECMADALTELMRENDYAKITINEIADRAGVNRSTWFRSFGDKSEALSFKLVLLWRQWADRNGLVGNYTLENSLDFFTFNYENRELISMMIAAGQGSAVYSAFYSIMLPQYSEDPYVVRFYSYGMFALLGEWNSRGFKESPDEMVEIYYRVMANPPYKKRQAE